MRFPPALSADLLPQALQADLQVLARPVGQYAHPFNDGGVLLSSAYDSAMGFIRAGIPMTAPLLVEDRVLPELGYAESYHRAQPA